MYFKINPSGCCERNGMKQVRFSFYLDKGDYGYAIHHIDKQDNPFHNHFIQVPLNTPEKEIMDIGEAFLHESYIKWACDEKLNLTNDALREI
jgi:hypothetical protein